MYLHKLHVQVFNFPFYNNQTQIINKVPNIGIINIGA